MRDGRTVHPAIAASERSASVLAFAVLNESYQPLFAMISPSRAYVTRVGAA